MSPTDVLASARGWPRGPGTCHGDELNQQEQPGVVQRDSALTKANGKAGNCLT